MPIAPLDMEVDARVSPMEPSYIESLDEPWKTIALKAAPAGVDEGALPSAATRLDQLEIEVRSQFVQLFLEEESDKVVEVAGDYWLKCLDLCLHLVNEASKLKPRPWYENITPRRLPMLLLEDCLDAFSVEDAKKFWSNYVEPALDGPHLLLGDLMWKASSACSLPFLRVCNQFLRVLDTASQSDQYEWQGRILTALARGFSVADRSALKLWGTFHSSNINGYETEDVFHEHHPEVQTSNVTSNKIDYKLYESFWSLQADFSNPNHIQVGSFMKKLKIVLEALESAASIRTDRSTTPTCHFVKYLTASSLLPSQLASPEFRCSVVSQFLIVSSHISSESAALANALAPFVARAKKLLQGDNPQCYHMLWESILAHREDVWRRWKKDKCPAAAFAPNQKARIASPTKDNPMMNGALGDSEVLGDYEYASFPNEELLKGSKALQKALPTLEEHLEPYVEALDPASGIEAEYHPGNDPLFAWRAMRLYAKHQLPLLKQCRRPADLERITREWYRSKGIEIPGEMMPPPSSDDIEDEYDTFRDNEEDDASNGHMLEDDEGSKTRGDDPEDGASPIQEENMKDEIVNQNEPHEPEECMPPDDVLDEQDEVDGQSEASVKAESASDSDSVDDKVATDVDELSIKKEEDSITEKTCDVAEELDEVTTMEESETRIAADGESMAKATSEGLTSGFNGRSINHDKRIERQPGSRRDREQDRRRKRSGSEEPDRVGKGPRGARRGGGRGGRREDGSGGGRARGRREDSPSRLGGRREESNPSQRPNTGPPGGSPSHNRAGGRYDDRPPAPSRGGRPDASPPRRHDDGPPPRGSIGRGGGGHRRDDHRREDSPGRHGGRREESNPSKRPNTGPPGGSPLYNRAGGRYDDRPPAPSRGGRPDASPPRRHEDGPLARGGSGRGGGHRRDDHRRGRDTFSGARR